MPNISAQRRLEVRPTVSRALASRPVPREIADLLCVNEAGADIPPRIHGRFSLLLVRTPSVVRIESSRIIVADPNWIVLVPAWQLHSVRSHGTTTPTAQGAPTTIQIAPTHLDALGLPAEPALVSGPEAGAQLDAVVAQLARPVRSDECERNLLSVLEGLGKHRAPVAALRARTGAEPLIAVREYLRTHITDQVSTDRLVRLSGLTESHLIRAFHHEFGLPPHAYQLRLRLATAAELLTKGLSASTVAYECGFADQSHLSRKFKEAYALTPAAWANGVRSHAYSSR